MIYIFSRRVAFLLLAALCGCAASLNPLYENNQDLLEPKDYLGVWEHESKWAICAQKLDDRAEAKERLLNIQLLEDPRMGRIVPGAATPADTGAEMVGGLVKIGDQVFLDLTFAPHPQFHQTAPDLALPAFLHMIQVHTFMKVEIKKDQLLLHGFDPEKLPRLLAKNPKIIAHKFIRGNPQSDVFALSPAWKNAPPPDRKEPGYTSPYGPSVLLLAEPAELRAFLAKHAAADIWGKATVFTQGNHDAFERRWQKYSTRVQDAHKRRAKDEIAPAKIEKR